MLIAGRRTHLEGRTLMVWAQDVVRAEIHGTILGVQTWSTGFWFATDGFPAGVTYGQDQLNGLRDSTDLQTYWTNWFGALKQFASTAVTMIDVQYLLYGPGQKSAIATSDWNFGAGQTGTGGQKLPSECACCIGMRTADPGPKGRGRSYFPALGATVNAITGGFSVDDATNMLAAYGTLLAAISGHDFDDGQTGPGSYNLRPSLASYTHATNHRLIAISTDTRVDSQRRREDKIPATRVSQPL